MPMASSHDMTHPTVHTRSESLGNIGDQQPVRIAPQRGRPPSSLTLLVGQIDGKLDQLLTTLTPQVASLEQRTRDLEVWRGWTKGGLAMLGSSMLVIEGLRYVHVIH